MKFDKSTSLILNIFSFLIFSVISTLSFGQITETFNTPGSGTFEVPAGVTSIEVEVWGAGGGGVIDNNAAGGGGGGGYARSTLTVTFEDTFNYTVGLGGTPGNNGEDSTFGTSMTGGGGASGTDDTGGNGGLGSGGDVNYNGGNGGDAQTTGRAKNRGGGGGGGSATSSTKGNDGGNGDTSSGGSGGTGEGNGGQGGRGGTNAGNGNDPGGGGGGKGKDGNSGSGGNGQIIITYTSNCNVLSSAKSDVIDVQTNYVETEEFINLYSDGSDNYSFGVGTDNDLLLEAFDVNDSPNPNINLAINRLPDKVLIQRAGTSGQGSGTPAEERHILFFEKDASYSGNDKRFNGVFFETMEEALVGFGINRGGDNIFVNSNVTNTNNIQRLDYIFEDPIVVPADPKTSGFPIYERGGNDDLNFGVISALDVNSEPSEYNTIITFGDTDWTDTGEDINSAVLSGFPKDGGDLLETANLNSQNIETIFVSFADIGLSAGDLVYGYSLAGADSTTDCTQFVDYTNNSYFPQDTNQDDGGIDLMSGGAYSKQSYIHTSSGWFKDVDPNLDTPDCDDTLVVSGGEAPINNNMTFGKISATAGSINLNDNNLDICGDINSESSLEIKSGTVNMNGSVAQFISGSGKLIVDDLVLDNTNDLEINAELDIKGILDIQRGDFIANTTTTFLCGFDTVGSDDVKTDTAQIDEINETLGGVVGNSNFVTEQCYPGRRAFRIVSPSATTSTSSISTIRENWQENASAWDDDPAPGYGTHITGVEPGNPNSNPPVSLDKTNGFDWQPSGNASMYEFDVANQTWEIIDNTDSNTLIAGEPYLLMVRGSRAVDLTTNQSSTSNTVLRERGNISVGDEDFTFSGLDDGDFILIGNPYQSLVDLNTLIANSSGIKTDEVTIWDPRLGGASDVNTSTSFGGRGSYATFDPADITNTIDNSSSEVNAYLQVMQSVFLKKDGDNTVDAVINFKETQKAVDQPQPQVFSQNTNFGLNLLLYDEVSYNLNSTARDGLRINFVPDGNNDIDNKDFSKFFNLDEVLARKVVENDELFSVEQRNELSPGDVYQLPIYTGNYREENYKFVAILYNLPANTLVNLIDKYTDTSYALEAGENVIPFSVDSNIPGSSSQDRFEIKFENTTLGIDDFYQAGISIYPNPVQDIVNLNLSQFNEKANQLSVFEVTGKLIDNYSFDNKGSLEIDMSNYASGIYILKIETKTGVLQHKLIKE